MERKPHKKNVERKVKNIGKYKYYGHLTTICKSLYEVKIRMLFFDGAFFSINGSYMSNVSNNFKPFS